MYIFVKSLKNSEHQKIRRVVNFESENRVSEFGADHKKPGS